ncbi:hypothetical protein JBE27_44845, partial [Streptomyces albiflaviniger]|nr:hypothetical protein [Streptomyces albiflaviniger]
ATATAVQSPFGPDAITYLPFDVTGVLMDAETLVAARQIFHDRNLLGVIPNKNVALASDSPSASGS